MDLVNTLFSESLLEETLDQLRALDLQVFGHIRKNFVQSSKPQAIVIWNCQVMHVSTKVGPQPNVAADLAGRAVAVTLEQANKFVTGEITKATSRGNDLVLYHVQANQRRGRSFVKVAVDGLADVALQLVKCVRLGKDRVAERMRFVSAFGRFFHRKDDFTIGHRPV